MSSAIDFVMQSTLPNKIIYSSVLAAAAFLVISELLYVWSSKNVSIETFDYHVDGKNDESKGRLFVQRVMDFRNQVIREAMDADQNASLAERTWSPASGARSMSIFDQTFLQIDFKFQQINVTDVVARIRKWATGVNVISGSVVKDGDSYSFSISLPSDPFVRGGIYFRLGHC